MFERRSTPPAGAPDDEALQGRAYPSSMAALQASIHFLTMIHGLTAVAMQWRAVGAHRLMATPAWLSSLISCGWWDARGFLWLRRAGGPWWRASSLPASLNSEKLQS
jgi:hypothetical protein